MVRFALIFLPLSFIFFSQTSYSQKFKQEEVSVILSGDTTGKLKILQITDEMELKILKSVSENVDAKEALLPLLVKRMYLSMRDSANPGVGIAAPQVGINKKIIWVQRFDKEGEPFEYYLNPVIKSYSKLLRKGKEGCLSIPDIREDVMRSYTILIEYQNIKGEIIEETIEGFTAVIFQHEIDHLNGILFTDRLKIQDISKYKSSDTEEDLFFIIND